MKREEVIEEAAKAIYDASWQGFEGEVFSDVYARIAFAVFEKAHTTTPPDGWFYMGSHVGAPWLNLEFSEEMDETGLPLWERPVQHTPTDDERERKHAEMCGCALPRCEFAQGWESAWDAAYRSILRRSVVPEPSAEQPKHLCAAHPFGCPEPQGEPSNAALDAAFKAFRAHERKQEFNELDELTCSECGYAYTWTAPDGRYVVLPRRRERHIAREALRAAGEVRS